MKPVGMGRTRKRPLGRKAALVALGLVGAWLRALPPLASAAVPFVCRPGYREERVPGSHVCRRDDGSGAFQCPPGWMQSPSPPFCRRDPVGEGWGAATYVVGGDGARGGNGRGGSGGSVGGGGVGVGGGHKAAAAAVVALVPGVAVAGAAPSGPCTVHTYFQPLRRSAETDVDRAGNAETLASWRRAWEVRDISSVSLIMWTFRRERVPLPTPLFPAPDLPFTSPEPFSARHTTAPVTRMVHARAERGGREAPPRLQRPLRRLLEAAHGERRAG